MSRWKAAGIHLAISATVIGTIFGLILLLWYPPALLRMSDLGNLVGVIAGVDVVAGPLLTLLVYKTGKATLKFDLAVIALIQAALLAFGLYTLAQVRPVFLVGIIDRFEIVAANEIEPQDLEAAAPEYKHLSWTGPVRVGAELPFDAGLRAAILDRALAGSDVHVQPRYYVPFERVLPALQSRAKPINALLDLLAADERARLIKAAADRPHDTVRYLPIHGTRGLALMLVDADTGTPIAPVDADPWRAPPQN